MHGLSDLLERSIGPSTRLVIDLPESLPAISVDPGQLELALLNLAVNARDAMPDGGTLTITAQVDGVSEVAENGSSVRLSVVDTGSGMDAETLGRATEPFFTTKGGGRGSGLGLSMVDGLAAQSGGKLILSSTSGVGTRAELWFPATDDQLPDAAPFGNTAPPIAKDLRILLVDDEPLVRSGLAEMLRDAGHDIVEVESAREALSLIDECAAFDLILTDHLMPGLTGAMLAQKLQATHPDLPLVLITGYVGTANEIPEGVITVQKPIRQGHLLQVLDQALSPRDHNVIRLSSFNKD